MPDASDAEHWIFLSERSLHGLLLPVLEYLRARIVPQQTRFTYLLNEEEPIQPTVAGLKVERYCRGTLVQSQSSNGPLFVPERRPFSDVLNSCWQKLSCDRTLTHFRSPALSGEQKSLISGWIYTIADQFAGLVSPGEKTYVVMEPVTDIVAYTLYALFRDHPHVQFLMIGQSRISPQHFFVSHGPTDMSALPDDSEAANPDADRIVSDFVTRTRTTDRVASTVSSQIGLRYSVTQVIRDIVAAVFRRATSSDLMTPTGSDHARLALLASLNRFRLRTCMRWDSMRHGEKYVLFPLQFYPETSSTFWANDQQDQAAVVGRVAAALPFGWNLAVKEHVVFSGYRTFADYRRIQSLPNVRLVNPMTSTRRLIEQSSGVVTLSSTAGLEALILGKPVLILGEGMYRGFDGVITLPTADADSIANLRRAISTLVSSPGPSHDIVSRQLTREARKLFRGTVAWPSKEAASPDNIARISEALWKCAGCGNRLS